MADIPANSTTTATISVGGTVEGSLEVVGDRDWFRLELTAGQTVTINLDGASFNGVEDPYLRVHNSSGQMLYENDDGGGNLNSKLSFTAPYTGTYFISAGSWNDASDGEYVLKVSTFTPPPIGTLDDIADQLVSGYWGGATYRFPVSQNGTITVNLTQLTWDGQNLARHALDLWADIMGVSFVQVSSGGQIRFDDNQEGAFADFVSSGGIISYANVNVSSQWLTNYGNTINSYSFFTYVHEIGHALGLGHSGNYNNSADYATDALFQMDGWPVTVMSYFDQSESSYWANQNFSLLRPASPMMADIMAIGTLYGLSTTTRTGDTTYGFNSTAGRPTYDASQFQNLAYTIFDSGGIDTLDYSGFWQDQRIDLSAGAFSDVGGKIGNVAIAHGVTIENAIGGSGNDRLLGNSAANRLTGGAGSDFLDGGTGADTLAGGVGNDRYKVDNPLDVLIEKAGEGDDWVFAAVSYALAPGVHVEVLTTTSAPGTAPINLTGNELAQSIYGNAGDNILTGGGGADFLVGGPGNDRYNVDDLDTISELVGGGDDWVFVPGTYVLRSGIEIETLVASNQDSLDPVNLTGNEFGQSLYGSQGPNYLNGGAGNDYLVGLGGNDSLIGGPGADVLEGGPGNDVYYAVEAIDTIIERVGEGDDLVVAAVSFRLAEGVHVETLSALPGTAPINLTGNSFGQSMYGNDGANALLGAYRSDYLVGGGGDDYLNGGSGNDVLRGDSGADTFAFDGVAGHDTILDFTSGTDRLDFSAYGIGLDQIDAVSTGGNTVLAIDSNRDGIADFTVTLIGTGAPVAGDYIF